MKSDEAGLAAEELTLRRFVEPRRRDRLAAVVRTKKRYRELEGWLSHGHPWDPRWVTPVKLADQNAPATAKLLKAHGAPATCHVLGGSGDVDGLNLPLIPGELAYHEGEESGERNLLRRPR
jgi:hypothetical protein